MHILFVCTANIVRSFLAERLLQSMLRRAGKSGVTVASAGLTDMQGASADPSARRLLEEKGIDADGHVSRLLTADMVEKADWIVVMEEYQQNKIRDLYPEAAEKVKLLHTFSNESGGKPGDIRDPYRLSPYHYRLCFSDIYFSVQGLLKCI